MNGIYDKPEKNTPIKQENEENIYRKNLVRYNKKVNEYEHRNTNEPAPAISYNKNEESQHNNENI